MRYRRRELDLWPEAVRRELEDWPEAVRRDLLEDWPEAVNWPEKPWSAYSPAT